MGKRENAALKMLRTQYPNAGFAKVPGLNEIICVYEYDIPDVPGRILNYEVVLVQEPPF